MKKLFLLMMLVVATISFAFSQKSMSSKDVFDEWNEKREKIEKMNEDTTVKKQLLDQLDSAYVLFFKIALENEQKLPTTTVANNTPANQTTQNTHQQSIGGRFSTPNFQGGSLNVVNASNSYATVITAEAQAYMMKTVADNYKNSNYTSDLNNENLFKCLLRNEDEFTVVFTIIGMNGYRISVNVSGRSSLEVNLLPGNYSITTQIMLNGYSESKPVIKQVGNPMIYSIYGNEKYSFVLTNPNI